MKKLFTVAILLITVFLPVYTLLATERPAEWVENVTVNGHVLLFQDTYYGSYQTYDTQGDILLIQQYQANGQNGVPGSINDPVANLWFLERDTPGSVINVQFLQGNPRDGFTDCLSKIYSYYPWGAGAVTPDFSSDPSIINLSDRNIVMSDAGSPVSGRYNPSNYPPADGSCIHMTSQPAPVVHFMPSSVATIVPAVATSATSSSLIMHGDSTATTSIAITSDRTILFSNDLFLGINSGEVLNLQKYLNNHGFTLANQGVGSVGNETTYFGLLTQKALARFQKAKGISPALGYFGPVTKKYINTQNKAL